MRWLNQFCKWPESKIKQIAFATYWVYRLICMVLTVSLSVFLSFFQFGRTEVIDNTLNPDFVRKFVLDFFFEEKQNLRFDV